MVASTSSGSPASPTASVTTYQTEETGATSVQLGPLQATGPAADAPEEYEPLDADDPGSYNLTTPARAAREGFSLETRSQQLFSRRHLEIIFEDPAFLLRFTGFLSTYQPDVVPILIYYLDALKAIKAVAYANAIADALEPVEDEAHTHDPVPSLRYEALEGKATEAFDALVRDALPAYVAQIYVGIVSVSIAKRITGMLAPELREASEGLAEVFCLSDPSKHDNPIIFTSEGPSRLPASTRSNL